MTGVPDDDPLNLNFVLFFLIHLKAFSTQN